MAMNDTYRSPDPKSSATRAMVITAIEGGTFSFAFGCIVQFWALFVQYGSAEFGLPAAGVTMTMLTQVVLMVMETAASFLGASIVERLERRKLFVAVAGMLTHGAWFVFGFVLLRAPTTWFLPLAFCLLVWRGFFDGMLIAPWFDLAARVVPPGSRARFFSIRLLSSSVALLLGGAAARVIFGLTNVPRWQFASIFWVGGAVAVLGDIARLGYRESFTPVGGARRGRTLGQDLQDMRRLLSGNPHFRRLCLISGAGALTMILYPDLVSLFAANSVGLSRPDYAALALVLQAGALISCWSLPRLVARFGWRRTYAVFLAQTSAAIVISGVTALALPAAGFYGAVRMLAVSFVVMGASRAWPFAEASVLYEISSEEKRPSALVLLRAVSNCVCIVVALLMARLGTAKQPGGVPYSPMFFGIAVVVAAACALLLKGVRTRADQASLGSSGPCRR